MTTSTLTDMTTNTEAAPKPASADWTASLDPDVAPVISTKGWKTPSEAIRSYVSLERMLGAEKVAIPGKDAKPEDWESVWAKLGRPKSGDGYEFKAPEDYKDYNKDLADWARSAFHKAGVPARMANELHDAYVRYCQESWKSGQRSLESNLAETFRAVDAEWGPDRDAKIAAARRAAQVFADSPDVVVKLEQIAGTADVLKMLARIGEAMTEDKMLGGRSQGRMTAGDAEAEIKRLRAEAIANPKHALMDKSHPDHVAAVRRMEQLYNVIYPS